MTSLASRKLSSLLLSLLLPFAQALAQQPAPASSGPSEQSQLHAPPRPDPKRAQKAAERGEKAESEGRVAEALAAYAEAAQYAPRDAAILERGAALRSKLVRGYVEAAERDALAGHADMAAEELAVALRIDPGNTIVAERMMQMKSMADEPPPKPDMQLAGLPRLNPKAGKQNLNLNGDTRTVYEQVAELFGVKAAFDPDLTARNVRLHMDDVDFNTAMTLLGAQTGTFWRPLNSTLFFVAADTLEKQRQFGMQAEQTFYLPAAIGTEEMTELLRILREITGATHIQLNASSRTLAIRDSPQKLALAGELIRQLEKARGEVMLEVELLEVDRDAARNLGITPPSSATLVTLGPGLLAQLRQAKDLNTLATLLANIFGGGSAASASSALNLSSLIPPLVLVGGGKTTFLLTLPVAAAQFSDALTLVNSGRQVLLRAQDGKPASFFVGDRFPVTLALLSSSVGNGPGIPTVSNGILPSTSYAAGAGPVALLAADFRNAGQLDLAVVNELDNTLTILVNHGNGTFVQASNSPIQLGPSRASAPAIAPAVASAVLTNSGFHDLLVSDPANNNVIVLLSTGDDSFKASAGSPITVGNAPSAIVTGDFNSDGNQDFAVTHFNDNTLAVFLGDGKGGFTQETGSPFSLPSAVAGPVAMTASDFNVDGKVDLAVVNQTTGDVSILLGNGDGTFAEANGSPIAVGKLPVRIAAGDLNGDARPDLAVLNQSDNSVSVLLNNGDATFTAAPNSPLATGQTPSGITIADFNQDGRLDIAVTNPSTNSVSVFLGLGLGLFAPAFELPVGTNPTAIISASLAGTTLPDVAITDNPANAAGQVTVILSPASLFASATSGLSQQPYPGSEYVDLGVKVKATPTLHPNDEVSLQLEFEIRALSGSSVNGIPILSNRTLSQTVRVKEDETTLIGGLLDNEETRAITGLPGFANLPDGLGYAFGKHSSTSNNTELLILITPRKLRPRDRTVRTILAGQGTQSGRQGSVPLPSERPPQP